MNTRLSHRFAAFSAAAFLTLSMLFSVDHLAVEPVPGSMLAQAVVPASS